MIDSNSIAPRQLVRFVEDVCIRNRINDQYAVFAEGGIDSGSILRMTLSIPSKYMHTNSSIIHSDDIISCIDLLENLIIEIHEKTIKEILNY